MKEKSFKVIAMVSFAAGVIGLFLIILQPEFLSKNNFSLDANVTSSSAVSQTSQPKETPAAEHLSTIISENNIDTTVFADQPCQMIISPERIACGATAMIRWELPVGYKATQFTDGRHVSAVTQQWC